MNVCSRRKFEYYKEITSSAAVVKYSENEEDVVYAGKHNEQMVEGVRHLHLNGFFVTWYQRCSQFHLDNSTKISGYFGAYRFMIMVA